MEFNINDYTKVVEELKKFIKLEKRKVEDGSYLLEIGNQWYRLTDNGGETNVELINGKTVSIPHTSRKFDVTPLVLAYRIACYLKGGWGEINFKVNNNDIYKVLNEYETYDHNSNNVEIINYLYKEVK